MPLRAGAASSTTGPGWELQNLLTVARLMIDAALQREESRGTHFRSDFPDARRRALGQRHVACPPALTGDPASSVHASAYRPRSEHRVDAVTARRPTLDDLLQGRREGRTHRREDRARHAERRLCPDRSRGEIAVALGEYAGTSRRGEAYGDKRRVRDSTRAAPERPPVVLAGRGRTTSARSPANPMRFVDGAPTFAVEVRSENDYGPARRPRVRRQADGLLLGRHARRLGRRSARRDGHRATGPPTRPSPVVFRRGDTADAEPAVPGWRLTVDDLFRLTPRELTSRPDVA